MDIKDRIEIGKLCAHGTNQSVDLETAYQMWNGIEELLCDEDKEIYMWIKDILDFSAPTYPSDYPCYSCLDSCSNSSYVIPINTMLVAKKENAYSEDDVRRKFDELLAEAKRCGSIDSLYNALERYSRAHAKTKEINPTLIRMGNNIGHLVAYYWSSIDNFFNSMNMARKEKGLPEKKSIQGLYQVIGGKNGMDDSGKLLLVEMANKMARVRRVGLIRPLTTEDFNLPLDQFVSLFKPVKIDPRTKRLLMAQNPILTF